MAKASPLQAKVLLAKSFCHLETLKLENMALYDADVHCLLVTLSSREPTLLKLTLCHVNITGSSDSGWKDVLQSLMLMPKPHFLDDVGSQAWSKRKIGLSCGSPSPIPSRKHLMLYKRGSGLVLARYPSFASEVPRVSPHEKVGSITLLLEGSVR